MRDGARLDFGPTGLAALIAGIVVFGATAFSPRLWDDGDTFWHLAAGQLMLDQGRVLTADPFSFTFAGQPWTTHEWLAEVIMAAIYRIGGWSGLGVLFGLAAAVSAALTAGHVRRWLAPVPTTAVMILVMACVATSLLARPHILALPLLTAWGLGLVRAREKDLAPPLWLLPLMVAWANLHGSFVLGLALIGPFALEALWQERKQPLKPLRDWGIFGVGALLAALITPHGLHGLIFPFQLMGLETTAFINEWDPVDLGEPGPFLLALGVLLFVSLWKGLKVPPLRLALVLGLIYMALVHSRHQMVAALIGALVLAEPLARIATGAIYDQARSHRTALISAGLILALAALGVARLAIPVERRETLTAPMAALAHTDAALRARPVFNDYGTGGYLIFKGVKPYIDGRADLYGDAFMTAYMHALRGDAASLRSLLDRYDIAWTLLNPDTPAVKVMDATPGWRRLYADRYGVVHVRRPTEPAISSAPVALQTPRTSTPQR